MTGKPVPSSSKSMLLYSDWIKSMTARARNNTSHLSAGGEPLESQNHYPRVNTSLVEKGHTRPNAYIGWNFGPLYLATELMTSKWTKKTLPWHANHWRHGYFWWQLTTSLRQRSDNENEEPTKEIYPGNTTPTFSTSTSQRLSPAEQRYNATPP